MTILYCTFAFNLESCYSNTCSSTSETYEASRLEIVHHSAALRTHRVPFSSEILREQERTFQFTWNDCHQDRVLELV